MELAPSQSYTNTRVFFLQNDCFSKTKKQKRQKTKLRKKLDEAKWNGYEKNKSKGTCDLLIDWLIDWAVAWII